ASHILIIPPRQARVPPSGIAIVPRRLPQEIRIRKNVVQRFDWMSCLILVGVEGAQIFLRPVEVQTSYRLAVIVVSENPEVAQRIPRRNALHIDLGTDDGLHYLKALKLFCGGLDAVFRADAFIPGWSRFRSLHRLDCTRLNGRGGAGDSGFQPVIYLISEKLLSGFRCQQGKLLTNFLGEYPFINTGSEKPNKVFLRLFELVGHEALDLPYVLQLSCGIENRIDIKCRLGKLLQLRYCVVVHIQEVEFQKGLLIHLIWRVEVSVKPVDLAVCKDGNPGSCYVEVPEKLACMVDIQWLTDLLRLDQNLDVSILHDGVVDFLALVGPDVRYIFRYHLVRVEDVITKNVLHERHYESSFRCLFGQDGVFLLTDFGGQSSQALFK